MAGTLFAEDIPQAAAGATAPATPQELTERVQRLEEEVTDLRGTVTRFADVMLGEVKDLREQQTGEASLYPDHAHLPGAAGLVHATGAVAPSTSTRRPWLLVDLLRDLRTIYQMYLDPRYRLRRSTQLMVPAISILLVLNWIFFSAILSVPIVSTVLEKLIEVLLVVMLYKVLSREMERYREALMQYAAWKAFHGSASDLLLRNTDPAPPTHDAPGD